MSDRQLRETLKRAHTGEDPPPFGPMWSRAGEEAQGRPGRSPMRRLVLGGALAAAAITVAWFLLPGAHKAIPTPPGTNPGAPAVVAATPEAAPLTMPVALASLTSWQGPTDFLLNMLGTDLLSSSTQVGNPSSLAVPGLGELNFNKSPTSTQWR